MSEGLRMEFQAQYERTVGEKANNRYGPTWRYVYWLENRLKKEIECGHKDCTEDNCKSTGVDCPACCTDESGEVDKNEIPKAKQKAEAWKEMAELRVENLRLKQDLHLTRDWARGFLHHVSTKLDGLAELKKAIDNQVGGIVEEMEKEEPMSDKKTPNAKAKITCLEVDCPGCNAEVHPMDNDEFWQDRNLQKLKDVELMCPLCGHEFKADVEF